VNGTDRITANANEIRPITIHAQGGDVEASLDLAAEVVGQPDAKRQDFKKGWTIRYITELQPQVDYYLRGEEYSMQMDSFIKSVASGKATVSSFESAFQTDTVIDMLIRFGQGSS